MKLFVAGISGLLGMNMALQLKDRYDVFGSYYSHPITSDGIESVHLDLRDAGATHSLLQSIMPDIIINASAITDVDKCEFDYGQAYSLNVDLAKNLALSALRLNSRFVHISSDQLFDGSKPWVNENEIPCPLNNYGITKAEAEKLVMRTCPDAIIVRTNFYGWGIPRRESFSDWIIKRLISHNELNMFHDVYFNPILINHLVDACLDLVAADATGVFNVVGRDRLSKYAFGVQLAECFGYESQLIGRISIDDLDLKARRPKEMSLDFAKTELILAKPAPSIFEGLNQLRILKGTGWEGMMSVVGGV